MASSDQNYLLTQQYHNAARLTDRASLHARFGTNPHRWFHWLFEHFQFPANARLLELGSGPGWLWQQNADRIPQDWEITISDFSSGMLGEAQERLKQLKHPFNFVQADAQEIPFPDHSFDGLIANHMLYHVPDHAKAFAEIQRVLRPTGRFYASTVGNNHLGELRTLFPHRSARRKNPYSFNTENGAEKLGPFFGHVTFYRYEDTLVITEAGPLVAYLASLSSMAVPIDEEGKAKLMSYLSDYLKEQGPIRLTQDVGLFEAWS